MDSLPGGRAQKLHVFERAMDGAARRQKDMVQGQISLFGFADSVMDAPPPPMPELTEFSHLDQLQMEKETTGVYITGHPLDEYADELSRLSVNSQMLADLAETNPDLLMTYDQRSVSMGGLITEKRMKATKSGNMMAFVQLEDLYGVTEVLVFPKVYEQVSSLLVQDNPVLMVGKLSVREEEAPKLLLDRAAPLRGGTLTESVMDERPRREREPRERKPRPKREPAYNKSMKLYLKLHESQRDQVLSILEETPGKICVVLYIIEEKKAYQAPQNYWVDEGYDFGALANLLGADGIVLK
jgi:DNA polymerase-3 subunit alpha